MVTDYLEHKLEIADHVQLEQHLLLCGACVDYVEQTKAVVAALRALPAAAPAADGREAALKAFRRLHAQPDKDEP
jgi:anti-sigma factor RsiW